MSLEKGGSVLRKEEQSLMHPIPSKHSGGGTKGRKGGEGLTV
jgi:hypothetical protein